MDLQLLITLISWKCFPFFSLVCNALNHLKKVLLLENQESQNSKELTNYI